MYILDGNYLLWIYDINDKCWLQLSKVLYPCSGFVVLDGLPTTIGGRNTNKLMSLTVTVERKWKEIFPPMPTERYFVSVVCTRIHLFVAGGTGKGAKVLTTVEVLNTVNRQWSTAVDLPDPLQYHSVTVCGDQLYMLGGALSHAPTNSVYTCSVNALLQTCTHRSLVGTFQRSLSLSNVWSKLADLPVIYSTCVTFCGQLLAVGGSGSDNKPTTAVYVYNQDTNSWNVISHMATARRRTFAAVLRGPNNHLIVVGGQTKIDNRWTPSNSVEFGDLC